jgi:ureidoglycolate dehydrogenase (NAD+)
MPLGQIGLGYKGTALAMIIDVFAGPLLGYLTTMTHPFKRRGVFLGAINLEAFTDVEDFKNNMDDLIRDIKSSKKADGFEEILIPGEPEWRELEKRSREGIFIDDDTYREIMKTGEEMGLDTSKYQGKPGKLKITHPSYTLKQRYE